jgi:thiol-disulfide isomerase/thioredoxin
MNDSFKNLLADAVLLLGIVVVAAGFYVFMKPSLHKIRAALGNPGGGFSTPLPEGTVVDPAWSVQTMEGQTVPLSHFKGKVIVLNFWATWCAPCRLELPSLEKLYQTFKDSDVAFLCVSKEDPREVKKYLQTNPLTIPMYIIADIPPALNVKGLPATFILSRSSKVALSRLGAADWSKKNIVDLLHKLSAER